MSRCVYAAGSRNLGRTQSHIEINLSLMTMVSFHKVRFRNKFLNYDRSNCV